MRKRPTSVAIVVATHNRQRRLQLLIAAVGRLELEGIEAELVVVDDGSSDGTGEYLRSLGGRVNRGIPLKVLAHPRPTGPAGARDAGWRASSAEVIAFTDDDCEPTARWLTAGVAGLLGGGGQRERIVQGMVLPNPAEAHRRGPFTRTIEVLEFDPAFQTANMLYRRSTLERIGGFDVEGYPGIGGGEDSDLGLRAIEAGAEVSFSEEALVHHAVNELGPIGKLRVAGRWALVAYVRYPQLRRAHFYDSIFWKAQHRWLVEAAVGLALTRTRLGPLGLLLSFRYLQALRARALVEDGGLRRLAVLAPYYLLHDLVEISSALRASRRHRRLMI